MCTKDPNLPEEVNTAKCWAVASLVFNIISLIGFFGGAWIQGLGGLLGTVGASLIICCGGTTDAGKMNSACILQIVAGVIILIGAIVGLVLYFAVVADADESCEYNLDPEGCEDLIVGFTAVIIFPAVAVGIISGVMSIAAGKFAKDAKEAMLAGGAAPQAAVVVTTQAQGPPATGAKFDPETGQQIPKFDPLTGKPNW